MAPDYYDAHAKLVTLFLDKKITFDDQQKDQDSIAQDHFLKAVELAQKKYDPNVNYPLHLLLKRFNTYLHSRKKDTMIAINSVAYSVYLTKKESTGPE